MATDLPLLAISLFVLSHLLLGLPPLRTVLRHALGEQAFVALFSLVAAISLSLLAFGLYRTTDQTAANPWLQTEPAMRVTLGVLAWLGMTLALAALPGYPKTPMALFQTEVQAPRGISKVSRHSFFVGFAVFALAHSFMVPSRASLITLLGFACLSALGALIQDRKLLLRHGDAYRQFMHASSVVPGWALLRGRTHLHQQDRLGAILLRAGIAATVLACLHPLWRSHHGAALPLLLAMGGFWLSYRRWRAARRISTAAPR